MFRISGISYLNTAPFLYGIRNSDIITQIDLTLDTPAQCAHKLLNGEADMGIVPVAVIPQIKKSYIVTDYCIGADNEVKSVLMVSNSSLDKIKTVYLDYQSRTSVLLAQILAYHHWKINVNFIFAESDSQLLNISDNQASVIIGDRALKHSGSFKYKYDFAVEWRKFTGLPFVFACWVANRKMPDDFIVSFNKALKYGIDHLEEAAVQQQHAFPEINVLSYFKENISFALDDPKREGMNLFLKYITQYTS
jgi:chorismate dehydratase